MRSYMNTSHVAKRLGVNIQTVRHYIRKGDLQAAKVGKRYVVTQDDVDAFLRKRKKTRELESIGLTQKGQDMVKKIREDSERILGYLDECPGAAAAEIADALGMEVEEAARALRRLEGKELAHCEPGAEEADRGNDPWYARPARRE